MLVVVVVMPWLLKGVWWKEPFHEHVVVRGRGDGNLGVEGKRPWHWRRHHDRFVIYCGGKCVWLLADVARSSSVVRYCSRS